MKIDDLDKIDELAKSNQYSLIIQLLIGMGNYKYDVIEWVWDRYSHIPVTETGFYFGNKIYAIYYHITETYVVYDCNQSNVIYHTCILKNEMINTLVKLLEL